MPLRPLQMRLWSPMGICRTSWVSSLIPISLRTLNFKRVKSPTELVLGILKLVATFQSPQPGIAQYASATQLMGQKLLDPPTVEGWHTGKEWIDGGLLTARVNFAVREVSDASKPGIQDLMSRLKTNGNSGLP